jgi:hypothetical protein
MNAFSTISRVTLPSTSSMSAPDIFAASSRVA